MFLTIYLLRHTLKYRQPCHSYLVCTVMYKNCYSFVSDIMRMSTFPLTPQTKSSNLFVIESVLISQFRLVFLLQRDFNLSLQFR